MHHNLTGSEWWMSWLFTLFFLFHTTLYWITLCVYSFIVSWKSMHACSVVSDSLQSHGLQPTRLLHAWDFPGKCTGVGCHCLLPLKGQISANNWSSLSFLKRYHWFSLLKHLIKLKQISCMPWSKWLCHKNRNDMNIYASFFFFQYPG